MSKLTTVIVPAYVQTRLSAHITMACIANIIRFTDPSEYELILIHDIPQFTVRDDYKIFDKNQGFKEIILDKYTNYSEKMNMAAKEAKGDYLAFIQNDCFVWEDWLPRLRYYIENDLADALVPDQTQRDRQFITEAQNMSLEEGLNKGNRDACMIFISKEGFEKSGGFNNNLQAFVEADFYDRCAGAGVRLCPTNKVVVTHLTLATHYQDMDEFEKRMSNDAAIRNK